MCSRHQRQQEQQRQLREKSLDTLAMKSTVLRGKNSPSYFFNIGQVVDTGPNASSPGIFLTCL